MKKIFKTLIIVMLFIPMVAFADMGAPMIREFEAKVIADKLVVSTYDNKKHTFYKGDIVTITGSGDEYDIDYKGDYYRLKSEDTVAIKPVNSTVGPNESNINKLEKSREFEVISDTLDVYAGPAQLYDVVGHLSKGDQVTAFYGSGAQESFNDYFYIQEENIKGWIYIGLGEFKVWEINATNLKAIVKKDITLNDTELKANLIEKVYYWGNPYTTQDPVIKVNGKFVKFKDASDYYLIGEGKKAFTSFNETQINFELTKDVKVYETLDSKEEMAVIPTGTKLSSVNLLYYNALDEGISYQKGEYEEILVFYNNKLGWIKVNNKDAKLIESEELVSPYTDTEGDDDTEPTTQVIEEEPKKEKINIDRKQVTIIAVIVAVSLAIMAFSSIILLNKKNKKNTLDEINDELKKNQSVKVVKDEKEDK